jgi:hypothetical protein
LARLLAGTFVRGASVHFSVKTGRAEVLNVAMEESRAPDVMLEIFVREQCRTLKAVSLPLFAVEGEPFFRGKITLHFPYELARYIRLLLPLSQHSRSRKEPTVV